MYTQKRLIAISLVLYVVSLSLPAVGGQLGIIVMITGVAFGWCGLLVGIIPGVAAYANVFYLWSVFRLLEGRQPILFLRGISHRYMGKSIMNLRNVRTWNFNVKNA